MTIEEVFNEVASQMINGLMFHNDMSTYFHFLGLYGYKELHRYHYLEETKNYMCLYDYYIDSYDMLLKDKPNFKTPIPQKWYQYTRQNVDNSVRKAAVLEGFEKWVEWEKEALKCYQTAYQNLMELKEYASANFINQFVDDVRMEINEVKKIHLKLKAIECDLPTILDEQDKMEKDYKKKNKIK